MNFWILPVSLAGGLLYRWRGHASKYKKYFPRPFSQILFAFPYAWETYDHYQKWLGVGAGTLVWILTTLAILTGHGGWMDLGKWAKERSRETLEFLIGWLKDSLREDIYDYIGMAIKGLAISLSAGIATLNPMLAVSGLMMGPAYLLGHLIYDHSKQALKRDADNNLYSGIAWLPRHFDRATELGEFFSGMFLWGMFMVTR